jgi:hypothetical protein
MEEVVTKSLRIVDEEGRTRIQLYTEPYGAYAHFDDTSGAPLIQVGINDEEPGPLAVVVLHDQNQGMVQLSLDREGSVSVEVLQNGGRVTLEVDAEGNTTIKEQGRDSLPIEQLWNSEKSVKSPSPSADPEVESTQSSGIPVRIIGTKDSTGVRVFLRGKDLGTVPFEYTLPPGNHEFEVIGATFFYKSRITVPSQAQEIPFIIELSEPQ